MTTIIGSYSSCWAFIAWDKRISGNWWYSDTTEKICEINWHLFWIAWYHIPISIFAEIIWWIIQNKQYLSREDILYSFKELIKKLNIKESEIDLLCIWKDFAYTYINWQMCSHPKRSVITIGSWWDYAKWMTFNKKMNLNKLKKVFKQISKLDLYTSPNFNILTFK